MIKRLEVDKVSRREVDEQEYKEFRKWIREFAYKKMQKLEKKLKYYARLYFEEPVAIVYAKNGAKIVTKDGTEGEVRVTQ